MNIVPMTLEGAHVRLEPIAQKHTDDLLIAAQFPEIWEFFIPAPIHTHEQMVAWIDKQIAQTQAGTQIFFAIIRHVDNRVVGVTSYMNISHVDRMLEIGGTWLTPAVWRTAINTECKYLLLRHAFETLGCLRVQLKTDARNVRSQRAIARLGAVREGVLRKYQARYNGYQRDTVMFSIIDTEWQAVKARLEDMLAGKN